MDKRLALAEASQPSKPPTGKTNPWPYAGAGTADFIITGAAAAGGLTLTLASPKRERPLWRKPLLFDDPIRTEMAAESREGRALAATVSDVLFASALGQTLLLDPILAGARHNSASFTREMSWINARSIALTFLITNTLKHYSGRERPFVRECERDPNYSEKCDRPTRFRSFSSGHAAVTATTAGLTCAHHSQITIYGEGWDGAACAAALGVAGLTGALRIISDVHWTTDVLAGQVIGLSVGYLLPIWLDYQEPLMSEPSVEMIQLPSPLSIIPTFNATSAGLVVTGGF